MTNQQEDLTTDQEVDTNDHSCCSMEDDTTLSSDNNNDNDNNDNNNISHMDVTKDSNNDDDDHIEEASQQQLDNDKNTDVTIKTTSSDLSSDSTTTTTTSKLGFVSTTAILTSFCTAGTVVMTPYAMGQLGYIGGPLVLVCIVGVTLWFYNFLLDVVTTTNLPPNEHQKIHTLGDVGYVLGGGSKGRLLFQGFQMANMIFYMPAALETVGLSLQYVVDGDCLGIWTIISFASLYVILQFFTCWHHVAWMAFVTVTLTALKAFVFLPYSYVEYQDDVVVTSSTTETYHGPSYQAFGNPNATWYDLAVAVSTFSFGFCNIFILFEVRASMEQPTQIKQALYVSSSIQVVMYIVAGVTAVVFWGWDVSNPITLEIPKDGWVGYLMNVLVILPVGLDYCISAKIANDWLRGLLPQSWKATTSPSIVKQLIYSLPTSVFAITIVLAIPNFDTLIGLVTGITVLGINSWAISLAWEMGHRKFHANRFLMRLIGTISFVYTIWVVAASCYEIATADYSSQFFCQ